MRFKATSENLTIQVSADEIAECIRKVVRLLVPQHARKVYLFAKQEQSSEINEKGLVLVGPNDVPSNFLQSFRIILRPGELVVVSGHSRFTRDQWRDFAPFGGSCRLTNRCSQRRRGFVVTLRGSRPLARRG